MALIKFGNHKLTSNIAIINMGSARDCPSLKLGLCDIASNCYALKAERTYGEAVVKSRIKQEKWWRNSSELEILEYIKKKVLARRKETTLLRFNESGDFWDQKDVEKLSWIAKNLKDELDITTYGYTARRDLSFSKVHFLVKGSGMNNNAGNNGKCIVIGKDESPPENFFICPGKAGSCGDCNLCHTDRGFNIAFKKH